MIFEVAIPHVDVHLGDPGDLTNLLREHLRLGGHLFRRVKPRASRQKKHRRREQQARHHTTGCTRHGGESGIRHSSSLAPAMLPLGRCDEESS